MVVAGQHENASMFRRAGEVGMLEHVAATVDAGSFAIPHRENPVIFRVGIHVDLLAAPDRRRREILVQSGLELDLPARQELFRAPQLRRPAAGRIQDRVPPVCSTCRFVSFLFVILGDGDGELEIVFVIRTRDVERGPGERQILADDVQTGRNGDLFVKQESTGRLAQPLAVKAKNAARARKTRNRGRL